MDVIVKSGDRMYKGFEITIKPEEYFRLSNGRILKNLYELMNALESMDDDSFIFHVNEQRNDFSSWIRDIFKDEELAKLISNSQSRQDIIKSIEARLFETNKKGYVELLADKPQHTINKKERNKKAKSKSMAKISLQKEIPLDKIDEILMKEKEIEKREEKIEEVEARIENELADLSAKKEPKFLSKEFIQGLLIGLLSASIIGLIYIKFFA